MGPNSSIPTSFVPKQPVRTSVTPRASGGNPLMLIATVLLIASLVGAAAVFGYGKYLESVSAQKAAAVEKAQANIDSAGVEQFVRTRDRLTQAKVILDKHIAVSQFFSLLESLTLQSVRFESLSVAIADDRSGQIHAEGTARTFNALAAESSAFASEKRVKSAIFSGISTNQNGNVTFTLDANLDPNLILFAGPAAGVAPAEPLVPATTTAPLGGSATTTP